MEHTDAAFVGKPGKNLSAESQYLGEFADQLDRMDGILSSMGVVLAPVTESPGPDTPGPMPEEAPVHDFHNRIIRFRNLNAQFEDLLRRIRL